MKVPFNTTPTWKPSTSLLGSAKRYACCITLDFNRQFEWSVDEWREYTRLLNEAKALSDKKLIECQAELSKAKRNLARKKPIKYLTNVSQGSLLTGYFSPELKKGRKLGGGNCRSLANKAFAYQAEMKAKGIKITNQKAAKHILSEDDLSQWRIRKKVQVTIGSVVSEMSRIKKNII